MPPQPLLYLPHPPLHPLPGFFQSHTLFHPPLTPLFPAQNTFAPVASTDTCIDTSPSTAQHAQMHIAVHPLVDTHPHSPIDTAHVHPLPAWSIEGSLDTNGTHYQTDSSYAPLFGISSARLVRPVRLLNGCGAQYNSIPLAVPSVYNSSSAKNAPASSGNPNSSFGSVLVSTCRFPASTFNVRDDIAFNTGSK
ncbi:hypothetical protein AX774_g4027 [Zancudomyces culisetae]|uniref:Uncharacterized protein n=1 Tax=Zancudomyces culisetae TaxID=1213189 RepID=A0A1R1PNG6_ZANCU|nr:hypothetical protein AX774_g4027 [Zancudomyces culisetae]|eukprot:OMH82500.1 hypothetical protein AX774_g4027 [Zancudomyces culisetae]